MDDKNRSGLLRKVCLDFFGKAPKDIDCLEGRHQLGVSRVGNVDDLPPRVSSASRFTELLNQPPHVVDIASHQVIRGNGLGLGRLQQVHKFSQALCKDRKPVLVKTHVAANADLAILFQSVRAIFHKFTYVPFLTPSYRAQHPLHGHVDVVLVGLQKLEERVIVWQRVRLRSVKPIVGLDLLGKSGLERLIRALLGIGHLLVVHEVLHCNVQPFKVVEEHRLGEVVQARRLVRYLLNLGHDIRFGCVFLAQGAGPLHRVRHFTPPADQAAADRTSELHES
mmetsp:Transcript_1390/g.2194  ORF Transcript_1390/g.2194 Transcript_1390/m.2194 type:complete len:280 (+) Transcript_1390:407-1246(+)